jgi:hypothetical protein
MSIAVLTQVYSEARRLAVAGSVVARGDFRLKKLLPPLEQAGKQAPVFAKLAEAATAVVDGPEESSAAALLELTSLVNAVLYTQGETGLAGTLEPIETTDFGGAAVQTSARVLKPLLEALSSTGSGRLELVKDALTRGVFKDLRLVKPALAALDDPYSEIADLIADKVLPIYGQAVLPELKAKYDPKGTKGHPRRLKLMHQLDPAGTRELVKSALDVGSKEVRVAAVSCLGAEAEDLAFLIEQASAKAQDVRAAAYLALAKVDHPEAVAVIAKGLTGKDHHFAGMAIRAGKDSKLTATLAAEIRTSVDALPALKDKKAVGLACERIMSLLRSFPEGGNKEADAILLALFKERAGLVKIKGESHSGADIVEVVVYEMGDGSPAAQAALVAAHAELSSEELSKAFLAGRKCLEPAALYDTFAPYLTIAVEDKKKAKEAVAKRDSLLATMAGRYAYYWWPSGNLDSSEKAWDPRWLDLAVRIGQVSLVSTLARPGHANAQAFMKKAFDEALKKAKSPDDVRHELIALMRLEHPDVVDAFFAALSKRNKKTHFYQYWYTALVPALPKSALPRLEEMIVGMPDTEADHWLSAIQELRTK